ncbi:proteasome assembly chaperone family protein [Candidatus Micrarchaeota archaeon]|nr:proteasome assembly chaperone family protein [Candidatus Micrarchaeota archaeon]
MTVTIREIEKIPLKNPRVIEGFPGVGMVGTICASYLAEKLDMTWVGSMHSAQFPPISAIHDFKPMSPARIYASKKYNLIVLFSEFVIPANIVYPLSNVILDFAKAKKASVLYSLAGIATPNPEEKLYGIASTTKMSETLKKQGVELIKEGATQGVSGILIAECAARRIPAANLLVQTAAPLDPVASAFLLDKVSDMLSLGLDTAALKRQGEKVQSKIQESMDKMRALHEDYKKMEQNPMYG